MTKVKVEPVPGWERRLLSSLEVKDFLMERAQAIQTEAERLAQSDAYRTGRYARSFFAWTDFRDGRWIGNCSNHDFKAWWIEFGTKSSEGTTEDGHPWVHHSTPARRILGRALDAAKVAT